MSRAFVVFILVLLLYPLSASTDKFVSEHHSDLDASLNYSTPEATQYSFDFWRWGKFSPKWRDTYEVLLEAEMIAVTEDFGDRVTG